jgi:hypothetical protein
VATVLKESADPKALLKTVVNRITPDPGTLECQLYYQLPRWLCVAFPKGIDSGRLGAILTPRWLIPGWNAGYA